jgi:hypothetical protein
MKKSKFVESREFLRCVASRNDRVFVLSKGKALMASGIAHTSVVGVEAGDWTNCHNTEWDANAIAVARQPNAKLITVGEDGDVVAFMGGDKTANERLPNDPTAIRNARAISGYVYACGMRRQVFKRVGEARWTDISAPEPAAGEAVGFEAIDGYSEQEVYAVGWQGEVWRYDGSTWHENNLPTNLILSAVCCAPDGNVYAAGQQGTLAQGRNDRWDIVQFDEEVDLDFWDLCWFQDRLWISTATTLFTLQGNHLEEVDFGETGRPTCNSLSAVDGVLWSVGNNDVASFDGRSWRFYP